MKEQLCWTWIRSNPCNIRNTIQCNTFLLSRGATTVCRRIFRKAANHNSWVTIHSTSMIWELDRPALRCHLFLNALPKELIAWFYVKPCIFSKDMSSKSDKQKRKHTTVKAYQWEGKRIPFPINMVCQWEVCWTTQTIHKVIFHRSPTA